MSASVRVLAAIAVWLSASAAPAVGSVYHPPVASINAIASYAPGTCAAVGRTTTGRGEVQIIKNGVPQPARLVGAGTQLTAIACSNSRDCMAVGPGIDGSGWAEWVAYGAPNSGFSVPGTTGLLGVAAIGNVDYRVGVVARMTRLRAIWCASASSCQMAGRAATLAGGRHDRPGRDRLQLGGRLSRGRDRRQHRPARAGHERHAGHAARGAGSTAVNGIACASAGHCDGVGFVNAGTTTDGVDFPITGTTPGTPAAVADTTTLNGVVVDGATGYVEVGARHNGWGYP